LINSSWELNFFGGYQIYLEVKHEVIQLKGCYLVSVLLASLGRSVYSNLLSLVQGPSLSTNLSNLLMAWLPTAYGYIMQM